MSPRIDRAEENFLAMTVHNTGFLLDRLGQDCHPLQYLRELTQNSIEAIQRSGSPGEIIWDVEWPRKYPQKSLSLLMKQLRSLGRIKSA